MIKFDHEQHFETLVEADAAISAEIIIRRVLVATSGVLLWLVLREPALAAWGLGYVLGDIGYVALLRPAKRPVSSMRFWMSATASVVLGTLVGSMAVYLAWAQGGSLYFIAACIVVGQALHCLASHSQFGTALFADLAVVGATTVGVTVGTSFHAPNPQTSTAILIGGAAVLAYFVHSVRKTVAQRVALRHRIAVEAQDQKMQALGQFTSGVAHDFNNILTVIAGNIELARLTGVPPEPDALLAEAQDASTSAAQLVRQLLAYSRRSHLNLQNLELNAVVSNFGGVASRLLPATVSLAVRPAPTPISVNADRSLLEAALMNLVINAKDAIGAQPGNITISVGRMAEAPQAVISVKDNGPGMAAEDLARATDPFFTTKDVGKGSGLGLSMVSGFAEQSGGELRLTALPEGGFEARLLLPMGASDDP